VRQLVDWAVCQRWAEARVDKLNEALLGGVAVVELQPMGPQLGVIEEVEHCVHDPLVALTIKFWELHLVGGTDVVVTGASFIVVSSSVAKWARTAAVVQRVLDAGQSQLHCCPCSVKVAASCGT
jgi:hypothetical protein